MLWYIWQIKCQHHDLIMTKNIFSKANAASGTDFMMSLSHNPYLVIKKNPQVYVGLLPVLDLYVAVHAHT